MLAKLQGGHGLFWTLAMVYRDTAEDLSTPAPSRYYVQDAPTELAPPYGVQAAPPIEETTVEGVYTGPYPQPQTMPPSYRLRPTEGWLAENPKATMLGSTTVTESVYSPDGDTTSVPAYTKKVERSGSTILEAYFSPQEDASSLPRSFVERIGNLPATYTVGRAIETYSTYDDGSAVGYRWAVYDDAKKLIAWVRAFQITTPSGEKIDQYEISTDYEITKGVRRPTRWLTGNYRERAKSLYTLSERRKQDDYKGEGSWRSMMTGATVTFTETIDDDLQVHRVLRHQSAQDEIVTTEDYQVDGSGAGTVSLAGQPIADTVWPVSGEGSLTLRSGGHVPYSPSRYPKRPFADAAADFSETRQGNAGFFYLSNDREMVRGPNAWGANAWIDPQDDQATFVSPYEGGVLLHPSSKKGKPILRWVAPQKREYRFDLLVRKADTQGGDGVAVKVFTEHKTLALYRVQHDDAIGQFRSFNADLTAGEWLAVQVTDYRNPDHDDAVVSMTVW